MSENKLKIELSSIRMVNEIGVRSQIRKAEVGFLVTGWDRDASAEVPLVELVEMVDVLDKDTFDLNQCRQHAACILASRLARLAKDLETRRAPTHDARLPC